MKITKRVKAGCALVLAGALVFPGMSKLRTEAAQAVDVDKQDCSITISISVGEDHTDQNKDYVEDFMTMHIPVDLYKVADVDVTGQKFTSAEPFKSMKFEGISSETKASEWLDLAKEASENEKLAEAEHWEAVTESGTARFENLRPAMYLVMPRAAYNDDYTIEYTFTPYLTVLPSSAYTLSYDSEGNPEHTGDDPLSDEWNYDTTIGLKPQAEPQYGKLNITKILDNFNETLGRTSFVFEIEGKDDDGNVFSEVVSTTHETLATETVTVDKIPAGMTVTVTEIYSGASYEIVGEIAKDVKIWSEAAVEAADGEMIGDEIIHTAEVSFENKYNGGNRGGYGVMNEFTNEGVDGWQWNSYPKVPGNEDTPEEE